jgi:CO/xanthine dehydrogenase FAD-binding subunit
MQPFELALPGTVQRALEILGRDPDSSALLAGGCDLLPRMKNGVVAPKLLIDLRNLRGFTGARTEGDDGLHVGVLATLEDLAADAAVGFDYPALTAAAGRIGSPQVRAAATLGGNLCQRAPQGSTLAPILLAIEAQLAILGPKGERRVLASDYFRPPQAAGEGAFDLRANEILVQLLLPKPSGLRIGVHEVRPRGGLDWPSAAAAVALTIAADKVGKARIVLGHIGPAPLLALQAAELIQGKNPDRALIHKAAEAAGALVDPTAGLAKLAAARTAVERALLAALGM